MVNKIIKLIDIYKDYNSELNQFSALSNINLEIAKGDFISIVGKSGSGKSTLLNMMSAIDKPSSGQVFINDIDISQFKSDQLSAWRGRNIGLVFQFFQLIPTLTVLENIILPMDFCGVFPRNERKARARELLERVELSAKENKFPAILSGGERQRVAIARSLANNPPIILADEPTGNLDSLTANNIFQLFKTLNKQGQTIVVVSHDPVCQQFSHGTINIVDGIIKTDNILGVDHA